MTYKTFSFIVGLLISGILLYLIRKSKLHTSLTAWWVTIVIFILGFALYPALIDYIGHFFKVSYPPIIICIVGIGLIIIKVLVMDTYITKNEARYKRLAQKLALLELQIQEKQKNIQSDE